MQNKQWRQYNVLQKGNLIEKIAGKETSLMSRTYQSPRITNPINKLSSKELKQFSNTKSIQSETTDKTLSQSLYGNSKSVHYLSTQNNMSNSVHVPSNLLSYQSSNPVNYTRMMTVNNSDKTNHIINVSENNNHNPSDQIMKDFFPNLVTKARIPDSIEKKNEYLLQQKKKRIEQYDQLFMELKNKRKTFSKFAFKSFEIQDNQSIRPVLEDLADGDPQGSMCVIDLWSDKNINKFLGNCKLIKDKLMISKIAAMKKRRGCFLDEKKPFLMDRKNELNLINSIYMNEQSKQFSEKYNKELINPLGSIIENSNAIQIPIPSKFSCPENKLSSRSSKCQMINYVSPRQSVSNSKRLKSESELATFFSARSQKNSVVEELPHLQLGKNPTLIGDTKVPKGNVTHHSKKALYSLSSQKNISMIHILKINADMIKDLDNLQEKNDEGYMKLIETINFLQDRIVYQQINNLDTKNITKQQN